ncbi:hypothetical protein HOY80DRAFT_1109498 [Tuber brumale]|nr:hypothetical protein HOY80DRAFT_1109498 [Tuber brumale]
MRAIFLTFFGIALLWLHQPALARRGGGGGSSSSGSSSGSEGGSSSGSSSGSGSSSSSSSGSGGGSSSSRCYDSTTGLSGNASDPFDYMYRNQWLYKFVGSYYNGSVEIEATIDMEDVSCDDQRPVFKQKLDAVLMVGQQPPDLSGSSLGPYMFSLVGWKSGTRPGGTPDSETSWVSPDARLIFESVYNSRGSYTKYATWALTNQKSGNGYTFGALTNESSFYDNSRTVFSISPCNGSQPVDFHMEAYDRSSFTFKTPEEYAQNRTRADGAFDDSSATLSITGKFSGKFKNWYTRYAITSANDPKYGTYKLKFSGNLDRPHSHALSTSGQTPSWTENRDLLPGGSKAVSAAAAASTTCIGGGGGLASAGSRVGVVRTVLALTWFGGLVAVGMGIVLW